MDQDTSRTVCRLIAGIVVSDDDLDATEDAFVDRMLAKFGLPPEEREAIFPILDRSEAADAIRALSPDVQKEALGLLLEAAAADGKIAKEEREYLAAVADELHIAADEIDRRLDEELKRNKR
jgi:uncharacterized tellurite resistance protein B-like protein